jgi:1-acyl-sn-glycerol-3-phosphate acyltransferase
MEPIDLPEEMNAKQLAQHVHSIMSAKIVQLNIEAEKLDNA